MTSGASTLRKRPNIVTLVIKSWGLATCLCSSPCGTWAFIFLRQTRIHPSPCSNSQFKSFIRSLYNLSLCLDLTCLPIPQVPETYNPRALHFPNLEVLLNHKSWMPWSLCANKVMLGWWDHMVLSGPHSQFKLIQFAQELFPSSHMLKLCKLSNTRNMEGTAMILVNI